MERDAVQVTPPTSPFGPAGPAGAPLGPPPPAVAEPNGGRRGSSWGRLVLVAAVVGLVSLLGAGGGGYAIARNAELGKQTARCGNARCIPDLSPTTLIDAFKQKGFTCEERSGSWNCELKVGQAYFETYVNSHEGLIIDFSGSVRSGYEDEVPAMTKSFLTWLGTVPVAHDPVSVEEVRAWLHQRFEGGADASATIGSYNYQLTATDKRALRLRVYLEQG